MSCVILQALYKGKQIYERKRCKKKKNTIYYIELREISDLVDIHVNPSHFVVCLFKNHVSINIKFEICIIILYKII